MLYFILSYYYHRPLNSVDPFQVTIEFEPIVRMGNSYEKNSIRYIDLLVQTCKMVKYVTIYGWLSFVYTIFGKENVGETISLRVKFRLVTLHSLWSPPFCTTNWSFEPTPNRLHSVPKPDFGNT